MSVGLISVVLAVCTADVKVESFLLWPDGAPGAIGNEEADRPTLTLWQPEHPNGSAVVVCPGGGYRHLAVDHEGKQIAQWLTQRGVAAFVLRYRLGPRYQHPAMMKDVQRAMQTVRSQAEKYGLNADKIGVWGFSAGGHLASTAATHFAHRPDSSDPIERVSSRPDFAILCYPVITMDPAHTHRGSRRNLLGDSPTPELARLMSNELQVTPQTPPTFLFHTADDQAVPVENALLFFTALRKSGVAAELHVYEHGRHGVGLAQKDPVLSSWPARLEDWLRTRGVLKAN